jgi:pimeloyl-ACP methyl ester carboxylesterase
VAAKSNKAFIRKLRTARVSPQSGANVRSVIGKSATGATLAEVRYFRARVLRFWKQKLDRWAINLAAQALPPGKHDPARLGDAAELLASQQLLEFPDVTAELTEANDGGFRFPSSVPFGLPRNDLVHGRIFRAKGDWRAKPFVVLVHGWNAELHYLYILPKVARALNRRGINAAAIELPLHLQRRPPKDFPGARDFISDDLVTMLRATRQSLADFHAFARWAREQGTASVTLWGFSLGAWLAGLYICRRDLASSAVLTTPIIDLERAVRELPFCHPIRAALAESTLDFAPLNLAAQKPRISPEGIQVCQCEYDLFVPTETYEQLATSWNLPPAVCQQSHLSVLFSRQSTRATIDWLSRQLAPVTLLSQRQAPPAAARAC